MTKVIKRLLCLITTLIALAAIILSVAPQFAFASTQEEDFSKYFSGGSGSASDPFLITNETELNNIRYTLIHEEDDEWTIYKSFKLVKDITITRNSWLPIEGYYVGTFDGNGKTIYNLKPVLGNNMSCGLFEDNQGEIKNLTFNNAKIENDSQSASANFGIIAGINHGTIRNCKVINSTIKVDSYNANIGSLVGYGIAGSIYDSENYATITGSGNVGGLIGNSFGSSIYNCRNEGAITYLYNTQNGTAAGIVGKATRRTYIYKCTNIGQIVYGSDKKVGDSSIKPCMAQIVGWAFSANLVDCAIGTKKTDYEKLYKGLFINQRAYCSDGEVGREGE